MRVSHTAINKAVTAGLIPLVAGKIDSAAPNAWEERRREVPTSGPVLNSKADAERRREQARADITEMEALRRKGELVSVKEVQEALSALITQVQATLLLIPCQLGFRLAVTNDVTACERILDAEIRAALTELSQWEPSGSDGSGGFEHNRGGIGQL